MIGKGLNAVKVHLDKVVNHLLRVVASMIRNRGRIHLLRSRGVAEHQNQGAEDELMTKGENIHG